MVQREAGKVERDAQLRLGRWLQLAGCLRVFAQHEDAARKVLPVEAQSTQLTVYSNCWYCRFRSRNSVDAVELDSLVVDLAPIRSAAASTEPR